ncbi:hypothetical protein KUV50_02620 [Membranicola marinus]|uniref:Uncharacterized protein n=1 Tax=Membranihabitans marinus TaxID=1227546 RepID=A0A953L5W4_9BACT|nr:hypothetical protein [Membranihabitans marinus]MBY5957012.1 hypothetical protein [Membranihabitans marinus]
MHRNDYNLIVDRNANKVVLSGLGTASSPNYGILINMPIASYDDTFYSVAEVDQFIEKDDYTFVNKTMGIHQWILASISKTGIPSF